MSIYLCSDLHGRLDLFEKLIKQKNISNTDKIYILGDVIDRGPEPIPLLLKIMSMNNVTMLMGNHEHMMLRGLGDFIGERALWLRNGGDITLEQYLSLSKKEQNKILSFLRGLKQYAILKPFILVHAGISPTTSKATVEEIMTEQKEQDLLWIRENFLFSPTGIPDWIVVFGHTPTILLSNKKERCNVWYDEIHQDKIGIDCGAYNNKCGQLGYLKINNDSSVEEGYVL